MRRTPRASASEACEDYRFGRVAAPPVKRSTRQFRQDQADDAGYFAVLVTRCATRAERRANHTRIDGGLR